MSQTRLYAGAGKSKLAFPDGFFPQHEGINGIHTDMHIRALIIDCGPRAALVSLELASIRPFELIDELRDIVAEISGSPRENTWLCVTHSLAAPHTPPDSDTFRFDAYMNAIRTALKDSVTQAAETLRPAVFGWGVGSSDVIVNRDIESVDGWWMGMGGDGPSDPTLSVLRFDDASGKPIALVYNHALKSSVLEAAVMSDGWKYASADLCGEGSRIAEEKFGVPTLFFMGAGGDQFPKMMATHYAVGEDGRLYLAEHREKGYDMLSELGGVLGADIVSVAEGIVCGDIAPVVELARIDFAVPGKAVHDYGPNFMPPVRNFVYQAAADEQVRVEFLRIGDCAVVGNKSELTTPIMDELKARSPFENTMFFSMVNGGQGYIADDTQFERCLHGAVRSPIGRGADRIFLENTLARLGTMYSGDE